jgi:hypothetical protein
LDTVTDQERIARRYPPPRRSRLWIPAALVLAAVGVVWLVWAGGHGALGVVSARVDAFTVRSDTLIDVTVTVERPDPSRGAECQLYAQAVSHDRVGELTVVVPPGGQSLTQLDIGVRTYLRATTAVIDSCHATG